MRRIPKHDLHLSPKKRALLDRLIQAEGLDSAIPGRIPAREGRGHAPLSYAQEGLWFIQQLEPDSVAYHIPFAARLTGPANIPALKQSLCETVRRHEILRTRFTVLDGRPAQFISEPDEIEIPIWDLSDLSPAEREGLARLLSRLLAAEPFDMERGPLWKTALLRLDSLEHVLIVSMHLLVSDGWSTGVLVNEFIALYKAYCDSKPSPLPELAIQYADYAIWQRKWLKAEVLDEQSGYWKEQLAGVQPIELPTERPCPAFVGARGAAVRLDLSGDLAERLKAFSKRESATLFMALTAAFNALLYRYSGQQDICIGTPVANRNRKEVEGLIGFFVNTLVMRNKVEGEATFKQLFRAVRETTLAAFERQDLPFEKLVEELRPERSLSRSPFFQVMLVLQNPPANTIEFGRIKLTRFDVDNDAVKFDLVCELYEEGERLDGWIKYNTGVFDAPTIERMMTHFRRLLESIVKDPGRRLCMLPMLEESELDQILIGWNRTQTDDREYTPLTEMFEEQAVRRPEAVAIVYGEERITYRELNNRANQLAHYLRRLGVTPEQLVGIGIERSIEMVIGVLGVLKAGGAYVPLEPGHPRQRLSSMIEESGIVLLLTQQKFLDLAFGNVILTVCIDSDRSLITKEWTENPACNVTRDNAAYVIYTSGSTGKPKGVILPHQAISNHLRWRQRAYPLTSTDRFLHKASLSFDISVWEIFSPLLSGAQLVIAGPRDDLPRLIAKMEISFVHFSASLFKVLLGEGALAECHNLKHVFCGGEPMTAELQRLFFESSSAQLHNQYGPTETTIDVLIWDCERETNRRSIPIGRPIDNTSAYILDANRQPAPIGVIGELHIGGRPLARGYLKRPDLTSEKFIPDPFGSEPGTRLYSTGDIARFREDGEIEYLGRIDRQVKIRGFRIEIGEIETILSMQAGIREAVVSVMDNEPDHKQLAAYIATHRDFSVSDTELQRNLSEKLPDYMIPSAFVRVAELPRAVSGKIDHQALPKPGMKSEGQEYIEARNALEEILCGVWSDVLGIAPVGVHNNFFELGGHSLLAVQAVSRIRSLLGIEVSLRTLFARPTVAGVAQSLEETRRIGGKAKAFSLARADRGQDLPLSFAQQRLWFIQQLRPESPAYNLPASVRFTGDFNLCLVQQTLREVARRHEILRTRVVSVAGEPAQVIDEPVETDAPIWDLSDLPVEARERLAGAIAAEEAVRPFCLETGPVWRTALVCLGRKDHLLALNIHHIAGDAWSTDVLMKEFAILYQTLSEGRPSSLAEPAIQYADYAIWQREWLKGAVLDEQLSYWKERLNKAAVLELPKDLERASGGEPGERPGAQERFLLSERLTRGLKELSRREGVTPFMTLLTAYQVLLARYSGEEEITVGTPVAGRDREEIEGLIGFFVNTLAMRAEVSGNPTVSEQLRRVRKTALEAYEHQEAPFEKLVEELRPERMISHNPIFQAVLAYRNVSRSRSTVAGMNLRVEPIETGVAKFDLSLFLEEEEEAIAGSLAYAADKYEKHRMTRMVSHLKRMLEGMVADPRQPVLSVSLLSPEERQQALIEWNDTWREYGGRRIHEIFEDQARRRSDAIAVVYGERRLSYGELNGRANRLARYLRRESVGAETRVGVCVERRPETVTAMLGVLKAGGAYVPLDAGYPGERLSYMMEDSGVRVALTMGKTGGVMAGPSVRKIELDRDWGAISAEDDGDLPSLGGLDSSAYVMYTSGSTGRPKGVSVTHRGVVRLVSQADYAKLDEEVFLHLAPLSFDASTFELWGALLNGGRVAMIAQKIPSPAEIGEAIREEGVTTMWLTSALFQQMVESNLEGLEGVRQLLAGGDVLPVAQVRKAVWGLDGCRIINGYGPTENTTFTCCHEIRRGEEKGSTIPIGRPIGGTEVYILDQGLGVTPIGVTGEVYISGGGLARGYQNAPELTAERMIPHPFGREDGERLYRSGDLGRYLWDGRIEFEGRKDGQVKIRGFRIEVEEIEAVLGEHEGVSRCAVKLWEDKRGEKRLVAYVVGSCGRAPGAEELREYLKKKLPEHMTPRRYVEVAELPVTGNGKLDRGRLAAPEDEEVEEKEEERERTAVEGIVEGIWGEVLGEERIGLDANFFELGGHSLLATQVMSRVREALDVETPLRELFESPTVRELAAVIERERGGGVGRESRPIRPARRDVEAPLSFAQQRLWFIQQLRPESPAYNLPVAVRLSGVLNTIALRLCLREIVRRHEVLRTTFASKDGQLTQVINEPVEADAPIWDLSDLPVEARERLAGAIAAEEAVRPFCLETGPVWRAALVRMSIEDHMFLLSLHHVASDGWSMTVLAKEFTDLYEAFRNGRQSVLPHLPIQYADFAVWQKAQLQGEVLEGELRYWKRRLAGMQVLDLPTDRLRPAIAGYRGARQSLRLSKDLTIKLKSLSRREGVTPFMTLLASFQVLLARYAWQEDVALVTPVAARNWGEIENLIGFFVNTLVMRTDLRNNPTRSDLLRRARETALGAYEHQNLPFEKLVEELQPERSLSRQTLFKVMFAFQNGPFGKIGIHDLHVACEPLHTGTTKFDLMLWLTEEEGNIHGSLEHATDLYDTESISRMIEHLKRVLHAMAAQEECRVMDIPLLTKEEWEQVVELNRTECEPVASKCVHELFEAQVKLAPEAVALIWEDSHLTYGELNLRANQLAHYLRGRSVGPEARVGICEGRSLHLVVEILGVLKAGAAYVPLDPNYPQDRIMQILESAGAEVLLTTEKFGIVISESPAQKIYLDRDWEYVSRESIDDPQTIIAPDHLAYVIYTSGSTGRPKGVAIAHKSAAAFLNWAHHTYPEAWLDSILLSTSICFDLSVFELFLPLCFGGRAVMVENALSLPTITAREEIALINTVPSVIESLLNSNNVPSSVRTVNLAGEALSGDLVQRLYSNRRIRRIFNLYGPTETTTYSTFALTPADDDRPPSIGRPISNTQVYILDRRFQPVPPGRPGELYIGGSGLARGYLNQPDLTAERFTPDLFGEEGARLYRTGDQVKLRNNGELEYLGRWDDQVKIRGFRIELGEIEVVLSHHPRVQQAVVVVREVKPGDRHLVACLTAKEEVSADELRQYVRSLLPDYMTPSAFVRLDQLPLTPNGKIDRRALSALEVISARDGVSYQAPQTDAEMTIASLWREVLGIEEVGVQDNFFDLGGHSLLLAQLQSKLNNKFDNKVSLIELFEYPTINSLALYLTHKLNEPSSVPRSHDRASLRRKRTVVRSKKTA